MDKHVIIAGGGAAGFFAAITIKEHAPGISVTILEKTQKVLSKVRISGGGRCNVTHACFEPRTLTSFYPRGKKELLSPFMQFQPADTMKWFSDKGAALKIESDGRVFPVSNNSADIVHCLSQTAEKLGVNLRLGEGIKTITGSKDNVYMVQTDNGGSYTASSILVTTGSSMAMWDILAELGHTIIPPVPSLFTFNLPASPFQDLPGISVPAATVYIPGTKLQETGPLLITHWGLSGPAILKISAHGARALFDKNYTFELGINWTGAHSSDAVFNRLKEYKENSGNTKISKSPLFLIPSSLWVRLLHLAELQGDNFYKDIPDKKLRKLSATLTNNIVKVSGKSTFKEEFVTCGGVSLKEVNFKTMESKILPNIYFAGEVLDIDAVTGGFNFQAAWTTGYIAGKSCAR